MQNKLYYTIFLCIYNRLKKKQAVKVVTRQNSNNNSISVSDIEMGGKLYIYTMCNVIKLIIQ